MRVTLKLATSLDGRIATASGESKWITGEAARAAGHRLRAEHEAILVGVETVLADDPALTVRLPPAREGEWGGSSAQGAERGGIPRPHRRLAAAGPSTASRSPSPPLRGGEETLSQPLRVILDSRLRTPSLAKAAKVGSLILTAAEPRPIRRAQVERVEAGEDGRPTVAAVLAALAKRGVGSVLIEGGGEVAASFLRAGAVDRIEWFRAPILLGSEGRPCVAALALTRLAAAPRLERLAVEALGPDLWERYERLHDPA